MINYPKSRTYFYRDPITSMFSSIEAMSHAEEKLVQKGECPKCQPAEGRAEQMRLLGEHGDFKWLQCRRCRTTWVVDPSGRAPEANSEWMKFAAEQQDTDRAMVELVNWLVMHAAEPCNWPLTYEEQVGFVRQAIAKGLKIHAEPAFALKRAALLAKENPFPPTV